MRPLLSLLTGFLFFSSPALAQLQSPDEFLPHKLGEAFTPHHMLVDYVRHVAANSEQVELTTYGTTYEGRPLLACFISTPENLARLEDIRLNNLRRTGLEEGSVDPDLDRAIVWLSFSVHGNEAAGSEASKEVLYRLADPDNARTSAWLENTIVVLDPCLNPDGYDRYTSWHRRIANRSTDPMPFSLEHNEPWPGGRTNHYLFDLNRDWAWQTQQESRERVRLYRRWLPHIHADLHEMGVNSPYYFAPAARPYHAYVSDFQAEFQQRIGENHARYFDREGWMYFTGEVYDLLYPSYGDTWPTFHGAIGMTYEQGGSGRAGRAVILNNGDTLTLRDRIDHHVTTSLSTVEVGSQRMTELLDGFTDFYRNNREQPSGDYASYWVSARKAPRRLAAFLDLLDKNGIRYYGSGQSGSPSGWDYSAGQEKAIEVREGDILIPARQPNGRLTQVLMDPVTAIEDSLTYDITAWALPYAYGLEAAAFRTDLSDWMTEYEAAAAMEEQSAGADLPVAWLFTWESNEDARLLSAILQAGLKVRVSTLPFELGGRAWPTGTLVIHRADNPADGELKERIGVLKKAHPGILTPVSTGLSAKGPDLGSRSFRLITLPRVGLLSGEGTSSNSVGQVWHYFERTLEMPIHLLPEDEIQNAPLDELDVLILPEGRYSLGGNTSDKVRDWIRGGGKLIAIGYANRNLAGSPGFDIQFKGNLPRESYEEEAHPSSYRESRRASISGDIPGAVFRLETDPTHPLAYGLPEPYFSLKTSPSAAQLLSDGWNVGVIGTDPYYQGFAGSGARQLVKNSLVFGVQESGRGTIVYLIDNPLYRGFWEVGKLLFANALFMVN